MIFLLNAEKYFFVLLKCGGAGLPETALKIASTQLKECRNIVNDLSVSGF